MEVSPIQIHCKLHYVVNFPNAFEGGWGLQNLMYNRVLGRFPIVVSIRQKMFAFR